MDKVKLLGSSSYFLTLYKLFDLNKHVTQINLANVLFVVKNRFGSFNLMK